MLTIQHKEIFCSKRGSIRRGRLKNKIHQNFYKRKTIGRYAYNDGHCTRRITKVRAITNTVWRLEKQRPSEAARNLWLLIYNYAIKYSHIGFLRASLPSSHGHETNLHFHHIHPVSSRTVPAHCSCKPPELPC